MPGLRLAGRVNKKEIIVNLLWKYYVFAQLCNWKPLFVCKSTNKLLIMQMYINLEVKFFRPKFQY